MNFRQRESGLWVPSRLRGSHAALQQAMLMVSGVDMAAFIASLYGSTYKGGWWEFSNPLAVWTDQARTTQAVVNDPVRGVTDRSPGGSHLRNTAAGTPTLLNDGTKNYVNYPGGTDGSSGTAFNANPMPAYGNASTGMFICFSANVDSGATGAQTLIADYYNAASGFYFRGYISGGFVGLTVYGTTGTATGMATTAAVYTYGATKVFSLGVDNTSIYGYMNGAALTVSPTTVAQVIGPKLHNGGVLEVGANAAGTDNASYYGKFKGRMYGGMMIDRHVTAAERTIIEAHMASLAGITL